MEKIAFISGGTFIYWSSVILTLAVLTAIAMFAAMYIGKSGDVVGLSVTIPVAMVASMMLSRLIHWYCRVDSYESMHVALTDYSKGGYALMGAFIACLAVAALLRMIRVVKNLPQMYDSMAIGGRNFTGTEIRQKLGLRSTAFTVTASESAVTIETRGYGHRVGMSQYGADAMAVEGYGYEEILAHYYQGTELVRPE